MAMIWPKFYANPRDRQVAGRCGSSSRSGSDLLKRPLISRWLASRPGKRARALRVLVIQAHPRTDSLCTALVAAYVEGACAAGAEINQLSLAEFTFDPNMHQPSPKQQPLEPDLARARELIADSDHLVFVYPTWW